MRVFISHVSSDHPLALYLANEFLNVGVETFMLPEDAAPGAPWMEAIRRGLRLCDEAVSLITPEALTRPWLTAEWACFWLQDKHCTTLLADVHVGDLWQPMTTLQAVDLLDAARLSPFLSRWAEATGRIPTSGVVPLANTLAREAKAILARQRLEDLDAVLKRIANNLPSGTDNIRSEDVLRLVDADRVTELVDLALGDNVANVKRKQVAQGLVGGGRHGEALLLAEEIDNRNEAKNVALTVVDAMPKTALKGSEEWQFLLGIFSHLGKPQRRDVLKRLTRRGITPLGVWRQYMEDQERESN